MDQMNITRYRYLIVDDDQFTRDLLSRLLTKRGAKHVDVADDGKTAIKSIQASGDFPDIIICDLNMPDLDGVEFVQFLSQEMYTGGLILISGSDHVILNAVSRLGKAHFLTVLGTLSKPFTPDALISCVAQYQEDRKSSMG